MTHVLVEKQTTTLEEWLMSTVNPEIGKAIIKAGSACGFEEALEPML